MIAGRPHVPLEGPDLGRRLIAALERPPGPVPPLPAPATPVALPPLAPAAELPALRSRIAHVRRFDEISAHDVALLATGHGGRTRVRKRLLDVGEGLDWSGTLADIDAWPPDSVIKDVRWRPAGDRALVGARGGLTADDPDVSDDIERMALHPVPIAAWPTVNGWADNERRLALRHHAGRLRVLDELLSRGLVSVPGATIDRWEREVRRRRQECVDALVALRLEGRLSWTAEQPAWDALFRAWSQLVRRLPPSVPPGPRTVLKGAADDVAAVAAETGWRTSATAMATSQSFTRPIPPPETSITVFAGPPGAREPRPRGARGVGIGVIGASVRVSWSGFGEDGSSTIPAPEALGRPAARRNC